MNNKYKFIGSSLLLTTLMLVGGLLSNNVKLDSIRLRAAGNKQTYSFVKKDFVITSYPYIPSDDNEEGYMCFDVSDTSGLFVSERGTETRLEDTYTGIGWETVFSDGCSFIKEEKYFSLEVNTHSPHVEPTDYNRELGISMKFVLQGASEGLRSPVFGDNSYYSFTLYYDNGTATCVREFKAPLEYGYYCEGDKCYYEYNTVMFVLDTAKSDYNYDYKTTDGHGEEVTINFKCYDIYKVTLNEISIEYSCSK